METCGRCFYYERNITGNETDLKCCCIDSPHADEDMSESDCCYCFDDLLASPA